MGNNENRLIAKSVSTDANIPELTAYVSQYGTELRSTRYVLNLQANS
jgi:hypothetical protein